MNRTTFYTDKGKKILAGAGMTFAQCAEAWLRLHGGNIIGMHVETDPIDPKAINIGPTDLMDYSNIEERRGQNMDATDHELKKRLELALDSTLEPMHELERRGYTVEICTTTIQELNGEQPGGILNTTIFNLRVFKQTTEEL